MSDAIETDYLVVGTGAAGMAFVDSLLTHSDAEVLLVDRRHRPGGHWNDAYPFIKLHGPSTFYGVCSKEFGRSTPETVGTTAGETERADKFEILNYYDDVMRRHFVPSGRVRWMPMTDYGRGDDGSHRVRSLVSGEERRVRVRRKLVDSTLTDTQVPATHPPLYTIAPGVACVPINDLTTIERPYGRYTIVGSGKTGMDACLWLLEQGVDPTRIRWIRPRDPWLMRRIELGPEHFEPVSRAILAQFQAMIDATSVPDLFSRLEAMGALVRIDPSVDPTVYRCATVSPSELDQYRRVTDVVRLGHVLSIGQDHIALERGGVEADPDTLYVDCSAGGLQRRTHRHADRPVFDGSTINLRDVMWCRPLFSAALVALVESRVAGEAEKNALCGVVPTPEVPMSWLTMWAASFANMARWQGDRAIAEWLPGCRLDMMHILLRGQDPADPSVTQFLAGMQGLVPRAAEGLQDLLRQAA